MCAPARRAMHAAESLIGNPGAIHAEGVAARKSLESSRASIARDFGVKPREIVFTPGLTAANNLAILGYAHALGEKIHGTHWIVSAIEHSSVLACFKEVEHMGAQISYVQPDSRGIITADAVKALLTKETVFVSVGWANNETGIIQPLSDIARAIREHQRTHSTQIMLHSDAGQAPLYLPTLIHSLGVDLLSLGGNKLYGPHGIGALYVGPDVRLRSPVIGGAQERNLWAGTENAALAAGFAAAVQEVVRVRQVETKRLKYLRDEFARKLVAHIPGAVINGELKYALPHMLNISIPGTLSEYLALALDHAGIAVSTKSACREGEESRSHVVEAMFPGQRRSAHTIRFSLGMDIKADDLAAVVRTISSFV